MSWVFVVVFFPAWYLVFSFLAEIFSSRVWLVLSPLTLCLFTPVPHAVLTPAIKLLCCSTTVCSFATVMHCKVNIWYATPEGSWPVDGAALRSRQPLELSACTCGVQQCRHDFTGPVSQSAYSWQSWLFMIFNVVEISQFSAWSLGDFFKIKNTALSTVTHNVFMDFCSLVVYRSYIPDFDIIKGLFI